MNNNEIKDTFEPNDSTTEIDGRVYTHRTKNGHLARIICVNYATEDYPILSLILSPDGSETTGMYTHDLHYYFDKEESYNDLIKGTEPSVPKTDWSKVKVDTLIWVKTSFGCWLRRYFCKYEDGAVWAYNDGCTSFTTEYYTAWSEASLTDPTEG
jgi:hypothetical protein